MAHTDAQSIKREVRGYIAVFVALAALTVLTVIASRLDVSTAMHIFIALFIAVVKGGLVAAYFMHLISEKKLIYSTLILTVIFFLALMFLPLSTFMDHLHV
ncbi:MAG TPA: cytochrome C oxidase subunit IV family protein [candidate division Zixibacteria bacterium]|jgi:cytochrome c oxidase subunit 4